MSTTATARALYATAREWLPSRVQRRKMTTRTCLEREGAERDLVTWGPRLLPPSRQRRDQQRRTLVSTTRHPVPPPVCPSTPFSSSYPYSVRYCSYLSLVDLKLFPLQRMRTVVFERGERLSRKNNLKVSVLSHFLNEYPQFSTTLEKVRIIADLPKLGSWLKICHWQIL